MSSAHNTSELPGPPLPAMVQTLLWIARPLGFMHACRDRYGDVFTVHFTGLGASHQLVFIADPQGVREVFAGDPDDLHAGKANQALAALLGEHSLLLLDGAEHLRERKLMSPPFHGAHMRSYELSMADAAQSRVSTWSDGGVVTALPEMQRITVDVIVQTVFGFHDAAGQTQMRRLLQHMLAMGSGSARLAALAFARFELFGLSPWGRFVAAKRAVEAALLEQIRRRRAETARGDDVLSVLLGSASGRPHDEHAALSDIELRDELLTLLVAGHETTATALAWALDLLAHHPAQLAALRESLAAGDTTYLDCVVKETLRIRPVVPIVGRWLRRPLSVMGRTLPAGTVAAPCIYLTHHDPRLYRDPEHFRPERFLEQAPDPYAWLPFGGGVRRCLGASFATVEMRVVLRTLLDMVDIEPAADHMETVSRRAVTLVPRHGVQLRVHRRRPVQREPAREQHLTGSAARAATG